MMKKILSLFLCILLLMSSVLVGCKPSEEENVTTPQETAPQETTAPSVEQPLPEGQKKLTSVSITSGDSPAELTAVTDLTSYLTKKGVTVEDGGEFPITLCVNTELGEDAFRVTAVVGTGKEESLLIEGGNGRGVLYGVYQFLEKCADVRFFTPELEICNAGDVIVSDGVILDYTPTLAMRQTDWYRWVTDDTKYTWAVKNGINIISGWTHSWGEELGSSITYAPEMFVHTIGKLADLKEPYPATAPNPCLTDERVYKTVLYNVRQVLLKNPETKILSISQNDNEKHCQCENCTAVELEEGSASGPLIRFVNRIAQTLAPDYPDLIIDTLAYKYTLKAPKVTKPAPNVCVRLSTITAHFNHPLTKNTCSPCSNFRKAIEEWSAICDNIYIWDYTTNYSHYLATFPNFQVLRQNMKFFAEHNVKGVYEQGNASSPSGEFGELRAYLIAKLLMNPYMTSDEYDAHMDEFLAAYYGAGWQNIRQYIDTFGRYAKNSANGMGIYHSPFTVMTQDTFASLLNKFNEWWDAAEAQAGDRLAYVQRSRWQLRYMSLFVNPDKETAEQLIAEVQGNKTQWREGVPTLLWYADPSHTPDLWFIPPEERNQ